MAVNSLQRAGILAALTLSVTTNTSAHHAFVAEYDLDQTIELSGTIIRSRFIYPHSWIHIEVEAVDGSTEEWAIEGATPAALMRRGWNQELLRAGAGIVAKGFPASDGGRRIAGWEIHLEDGSTLFMASSGISHLDTE